MSTDPEAGDPATDGRPSPSAGEEAAGTRLRPSAAAPTETGLVPHRPLQPGTLLGGRYRILQLLGIGGMGMVYRAHDAELEIVVALKTLRPERADRRDLIERFRQEIILARQVTHPNVVRIHDLGHDGDLYFLTMDFIPGRSLERVLEVEGPYEPSAAVALFRQVVAGLEAAHGRGVVHRDLKPANILVNDEGKAFITDFGIARSVAVTGFTATGQVVGTPDYLSPEQATGEDLDHRTDLYSAGLILFEMLAVRSPFQGRTVAEILAQRVSGRPRRWDEVGVEAPAWLQRVLDRCLQRDPDDRYPDAAALGADLDRQAADPVTGRRRRASGMFSRQGIQGVLGVAVVAVVSLLLVAAGLRWWSGRQEAAVGGSAAPVPAERHAVAVLPLEDGTGRPDLAWVSNGIAEMVSSALAESPDLRVVDTPRVVRTLEDLRIGPGLLRENELALTAEMLDVDRIVMGSVRAAADRIRVEAQLVEADDPDLPRRRLQAEVEDAGQVFSLVDRLGEDLRQLLEGAPPELGRGEPIAPAALEAYSRGVASLSRGDAVAAAPDLETAVEEDPTFTEAWVRLAAAYEILGYSEKALEAARRAVEQLEPDAGRLGLEARARLAGLQGNPERARDLLTELTTSYPHDMQARVALGEAYAAEGRLGEASAILEDVVQRDPNHPRAWYLLGRYAIIGGDSRMAIDKYLVHALVVQNRLGDAQGKADVLNAMGAAEENLGQVTAAQERYREAAGIRQEIGDRRGYSASLSNLAALQALTGELGAAEENLAEALEIRREIGDRPGTARLLNQQGLLLEQQGRYEPALELFRQALQTRRELGDRGALAESHNNVGFAYYVLGDYENAGVYWSRALDLYEETGNRQGAVFTAQSLGQLELARGRWEEASRTFLHSLEESRQLDLPDAEALSTGFLGRLAQFQGRYGAAVSSYREALTKLERVGDNRGVAEFSLYLASAYLELGAEAQAREILDRFDGGGLEARNRDQRAELARLRGELALATGDLRAAREEAARAVEEALASGHRVATLKAQLLAAQVAPPGTGAPSLGDLAEAAEALGDRSLLLSVLFARARGALDAGEPAAAEGFARRLLQLAPSPAAGAYRYHLALGQALEKQGRSEEARRELVRAQQEAQRLRRGLSPELQESFGRLSEVESLGGLEAAA